MCVLRGLPINNHDGTIVHFATIILFGSSTKVSNVLGSLNGLFHILSKDAFQFPLGTPFLLLKDCVALSCFKGKHSLSSIFLAIFKALRKFTLLSFTEKVSFDVS